MFAILMQNVIIPLVHFNVIACMGFPVMDLTAQVNRFSELTVHEVNRFSELTVLAECEYRKPFNIKSN